MNLGIFGAGGLGREVLDIANGINSVEKKWDRILFVDDADVKQCSGIEVYSFIRVCETFGIDEIEFSVAVGEPKTREAIVARLHDKGNRIASLIHQYAHVSPSAEIGVGVIICFGSYVSCNTRILDNAYIQPNAMIGHDCVIGKNSVVGPCAAIAGSCHIGETTYIGMGTTVKEIVTIGDHTVIGMSSAVYKDIPSNMIALGNPARVVKTNEGGAFRHG